MRATSSLLLLLAILLGVTGLSRGAADASGSPPPADDPSTLWVDRPLARVEIVGLRKTRPHVVRREITQGAGDTLRWKRVERDRRRLLDLGLFADISVSAHRDSTLGRPVLTYRLSERPTFLALPILEYDPEDRFSYGAYVFEQNFRGRGEHVGLSGRLGGRKGVAVGYAVPWILGHRIGAGFQLFSTEGKKRTEGIYETSRGFGLQISPSASYATRLGVSAGVEDTRTRPLHPDDPDHPPRERDEHRWLGVGVSADTRDYRFEPTGGFVLAAGATQNGGPIGGTTDFRRYHLDALRVFGTGGRSALTVGTRMLWSDGPVPRFLRINLGGINTLRGHPQGELGGESRWIGWIEQRVPVLAKHTFSVLGGRYRVDYTVDAAAFFDAGTIWEKDELLEGKARARWGGGVGLRLIVPLAQIVRFDAATDGKEIRFYGAAGMRL